MVAHRLGQDEAYFTVREILAEASTAADGVRWREPSDFSRCECGNVRVNYSFLREHVGATGSVFLCT